MNQPKRRLKMSEIKYNEIQLNKLNRRDAGIWAFRVLNVTQEGIIIQLPKAFGEEATAEIPLSDKVKALYTVDSYADITLSYTVSEGKSSSYQARYWGKTPPKFIPTNGEKISRA